DKDWYKIDHLTIGATYTVSASDVSMTSGRVAISLNNADGSRVDINQIGNNTDDFADSSSPTFTFVATSTQYFVSVSAGSADATSTLYATSRYKVQVTQSTQNHAPVANNDSYTTSFNTALTKTAATGVLANDTDLDGNALTVSSY